MKKSKVMPAEMAKSRLAGILNPRASPSTDGTLVSHTRNISERTTLTEKRLMLSPVPKNSSFSDIVPQDSLIQPPSLDLEKELETNAKAGLNVINSDSG